jgi:aryl-alcohol dehydrogenase-like predicted oxidoreductase
LELTPLPYGTWQPCGGCGPEDDRADIEAIGHARSLGINFFDSAQAYGCGQVTETRAGRC